MQTIVLAKTIPSSTLLKRYKEVENTDAKKKRKTKREQQVSTIRLHPIIAGVSLKQQPIRSFRVMSYFSRNFEFLSSLAWNKSQPVCSLVLALSLCQNTDERRRRGNEQRRVVTFWTELSPTFYFSHVFLPGSHFSFHSRQNSLFN